MRAKEPSANPEKPLLMVDIDGVISLFGFPEQPPWAIQAHAGEGVGEGSESVFHTVDGIPHFLSRSAAAHLLALAEHFDLVWASGWEEKADEHLPRLLELPAGLPFLRFERDDGGAESPRAHWKLAAIDRYAGARALAWVDDALNDACHAWAAARDARGAPTLLVQTTPAKGLTKREATLLANWATELAQTE